MQIVYLTTVSNQSENSSVLLHNLCLADEVFEKLHEQRVVRSGQHDVSFNK